jgi:eukaryotic-like serine/threonine-protein kinase
LTLATGSRLGPYEILSPLGAGGMGEVYRARDTRLERDVAIKVLPEELSQDVERLSRFEQEARSASGLNHPNIVTIHDIGRAGPTSYIAMEFVEGKTVRELAAAGPLSLKRALSIGAQVADGLAKAHAAGIVHRDLKPENLMVSSDGFLKILDFGLAKLVAPRSEQVSAALTMAGPRTATGIVVGTVGYMSPEQASGAPLDFRSDQFSLGAILYEIVTGRRAFARATAVDTLSAILHEEPEPVASLRAEAPLPLRWLIERCLAKDPEDRYVSTRDLARELATMRDHLSEIGRSGEKALADFVGSPRPRRWLVPFAAGLAAGLTLAAGFFALRRPVRTEPAAIHYLTYSGHDRAPAVSPDGRTIAFASDRDGQSRIWLKQLAGGGEAALTSGPDDLPRFSPDGSMLLFARREPAHPSLYRTGIVGGEARKLVEDAAEGDWSPDGRQIVVLRWKSERGLTDSSLAIAPAEGGETTEVVRIPAHQLTHPRWSPDGKTIATTELGAGGAAKFLFLIDVASKKIRLLSPQSAGLVSAPAWSGDGDLVYSKSESVVANVTSSAGRVMRQNARSGRMETLFWSPTNSDVLDVLGPGRLVFDGRSLRENLQEFPLAAAKAIVPAARWLTQGNSTDRQPVYSPDGEWVAFSSTRSGNLDLWEVSTRTGSVRRLTDDDAEDWDPAFLRDGKRLIWSSNRSGAFEIWSAESDGSSARQLTRDKQDAENPTATPDGNWIVFTQVTGPGMGLWKIHPDGSGAAKLFSGNTLLPEVSPDGQYVSYRTNLRTDLTAIRVVRVSDGSAAPFEAQVQVRSGFSANSVGRSRWMPDGRSLVFVGQDESGAYGLYAQDFEPGQDTSKTRHRLVGFDPGTATESFGISPDGTRITIAGWEQVFSLMVAEHVPGVSLPQRKSR